MPSWRYSLEFPLWCHRSWSLQWCAPIPWGCKDNISGTPGRQAKTPGFNERFHPRNFRHWSISTRKPEVQKILKNSKKMEQMVARHKNRWRSFDKLTNWQTPGPWKSRTGPHRVAAPRSPSGTCRSYLGHSPPTEFSSSLLLLGT